MLTNENKNEEGKKRLIRYQSLYLKDLITLTIEDRAREIFDEKYDIVNWQSPPECPKFIYQDKTDCFVLPKGEKREIEPYLNPCLVDVNYKEFIAEPKYYEVPRHPYSLEILLKIEVSKICENVGANFFELNQEALIYQYQTKSLKEGGFYRKGIHIVKFYRFKEKR